MNRPDAASMASLAVDSRTDGDQSTLTRRPRLTVAPATGSVLVDRYNHHVDFQILKLKRVDTKVAVAMIDR